MRSGQHFLGRQDGCLGRDADRQDIDPGTVQQGREAPRGSQHVRRRIGAINYGEYHARHGDHLRCRQVDDWPYVTPVGKKPPGAWPWLGAVASSGWPFNVPWRKAPPGVSSSSVGGFLLYIASQPSSRGRWVILKPIQGALSRAGQERCPQVGTNDGSPVVPPILRCHHDAPADAGARSFQVADIQRDAEFGGHVAVPMPVTLDIADPPAHRLRIRLRGGPDELPRVKKLPITDPFQQVPLLDQERGVPRCVGRPRRRREP